MAKFKNYNKETINSSSMRQPQKNRNSTNIVLPPHIMANVQNINSNNEKKFLKENANRYTWEGRLNSFSPLKKIDLKIVNKNLSLSFAEFKKMQKNKK
jgi:glycosylphosphatidylinositol transamidase (GPIT) subunit GPI8